jgi:hypothetical protein
MISSTISRNNTLNFLCVNLIIFQEVLLLFFYFGPFFVQQAVFWSLQRFLRFRKLFPLCGFVRGLDVGNVSIRSGLFIYIIL